MYKMRSEHTDIVVHFVFTVARRTDIIQLVLIHTVLGHTFFQGIFCGESCANRWRGMLFGMTNRAGWVGGGGWNGRDPNDNQHLWKLWDSFSIDEADMYGWWNRSNPVTVTPANAGIYATAFVRVGTATLVALASWNESDVDVTIVVDWEAIGIPATHTTSAYSTTTAPAVTTPAVTTSAATNTAQVVAPLLPSFNHAQTQVDFPVSAGGAVGTMRVPGLKGLLVVISSRGA